MDSVAGGNSVDSNFGIGRATKKVRTRTDISFDFDNLTIDSNGQKIPSEGFKPSYKSMLIGDSQENQYTKFREEAFSLVDGDAVTEMRWGAIDYVLRSSEGFHLEKNG